MSPSYARTGSAKCCGAVRRFFIIAPLRNNGKYVTGKYSTWEIQAVKIGYILRNILIQDLFRLSSSRAAQSIEIIKWRRSSVLPASSPVPPAPRCSLRNATHARRNLSLVCCTVPLILSGRRPAVGQSLDITRKSSSSMFIDPKAVSLCHKNDRGTWGVPDRLWCSACVHLRMPEHWRHHYVQHVYMTICLIANDSAN